MQMLRPLLRIDEDGSHHTVDLADVNDYLREFETFASETEAKRNILRAIESVAARHGNTPS